MVLLLKPEDFWEEQKGQPRSRGGILTSPVPRGAGVGVVGKPPMLVPEGSPKMRRGALPAPAAAAPLAANRWRHSIHEKWHLLKGKFCKIFLSF